MARSYVSPNVVNRFELQPRSGERSYNLLGDCQMPNDSRLANEHVDACQPYKSASGSQSSGTTCLTALW